ncbi:unnamed protein product, partial [Discosporangium mesarthrocarpum]
MAISGRFRVAQAPRRPTSRNRFPFPFLVFVCLTIAAVSTLLLQTSVAFGSRPVKLAKGIADIPEAVPVGSEPMEKEMDEEAVVYGSLLPTLEPFIDPNLEQPFVNISTPSPPFGWSLDWVHGISMFVDRKEVINPPWCMTPENRSVVDYLLERRLNVDPSNRVAACLRTKNMGRYLPQWAAYHWVAGIDEFMVYDDHSEDDTRQVLEPFIRAGILQYQRFRQSKRSDRLKPLHECAAYYRRRVDSGDKSSPRWIVFIDSDEYLWTPNVLETIGEVLKKHSSTCCMQVSRVQYGSMGHINPPQGLITDSFLMHAAPGAPIPYHFPKVVANLRPLRPKMGKFGRLKNPHATDDCPCDTPLVSDIRVNHYLMSKADFVAKTKHYWEVGYSEDEVESLFNERDINYQRSDAITHWSCATRLILDRAASGRNVLTDQRLIMNPLHPANQGYMPIDMSSNVEARRTNGCIAKIHATPTASGTSWGSTPQVSEWVNKLCQMRFLFSHGIAGTGEGEIARLLGRHPWVESHPLSKQVFPNQMGGIQVHPNKVPGRGAHLTSVLRPMKMAEEFDAQGMKDLEQLCKCTLQGCSRYCPKLQQDLLETNSVNANRRQLLQDWVIRFEEGNAETGNPRNPRFLVEQDPDFFLWAKQSLFPFVSVSILGVRHPLCTPFPSELGTDQSATAPVAVLMQAIETWVRTWSNVLVGQLPFTEGDVWVVRFEDLLLEEEEVQSHIWAAVGLPPLFPR